MSYQEFKSWQMFYLIEPWGWYDREYRTAALLAMMVNVNKGKKGKNKTEQDFMRDMPSLVEKAYHDQSSQEAMREKLLTANINERRQMIARAFGTIVKDVKIGDGSNDSGQTNT
jgi:hypothetical protein